MHSLTSASPTPRPRALSSTTTSSMRAFTQAGVVYTITVAAATIAPFSLATRSVVAGSERTAASSGCVGATRVAFSCGSNDASARASSGVASVAFWILRAPAEKAKPPMMGRVAAVDLDAIRDRLMAAVEHESAPLELSSLFVRGEPITYAEAIRGEFSTIRVGDRWGPPWSTTWFHVTGRVPTDWAGRQAVARFDLGFEGPTGFTCEALAWKGGRPWRGVDPNHRWLPIDQSGGPDVDFYLEAAANPRATEQGAEPAPSMVALRDSPEPAFVLGQTMLAIQNSAEPAASDGRLDLSHRITAVGHAHIDTAWEWPIRESNRKVAPSWSTQLALMDEYPDYVFAASQPLQYEWMKELQPDIYRRIKEMVAAGRWEAVGAMWVEADCNLPSGESLVRQLLHGKRFFMREFGYETRILWLADVFGYPGNLPQLMAEAGFDFFLSL